MKKVKEPKEIKRISTRYNLSSKIKDSRAGITIIALVVTIIVLLILAGVTIATLTGENGILKRTKKAEFKNDISAFQEELNISIYGDYTEKLGNREEKDKFNAQGYEEIIKIIPNFKRSYQEKIAVKNDKIVYIGVNEEERKWIEETGIDVAKVLKINYVDANGTVLKDPYIAIITEKNYSVKSPEIEGYIPIREYVEGTITDNTEINVEYYIICNDLAFEGLDENGKVTEVQENIVSYAVTGMGNCNNPNLCIPYEYNGKIINKIKEKAFFNNKIITNLIIKENIKDIGLNAFFKCTNLKMANINADNIGVDAFWECTSLESVIINSNVKKIERYGFEYCENLKDFIIYSEDITFNGWGIFRECKNLKELKVNQGNKKYKMLNGMLYTIDEKELIQAPTALGGDIVISPEVVKICTGAFSYNGNIKNITIPENVTFIGSRAFQSCINLENITIPENVKSIGEQICLDCTNLKNANINSQDTGFNTFWRCTSLENVTISKNCKKIGAYCFETCKKLTSINYLGTKEEWNNISKNALWKSGGDTITTVKCIDGDLSI